MSFPAPQGGGHETFGIQLGSHGQMLYDKLGWLLSKIAAQYSCIEITFCGLKM